MTTLIVKVNNGHAESLKRILHGIPYVHTVEEETANFAEPTNQYERIKEILEKAQGGNLFKDIKEPVEWQREIRKEWDRNFTNNTNTTIDPSVGQRA